MKVLIVGANGDLGRRCVQFALDSSHEVVAFVRSKSKFLDNLPPEYPSHPALTVSEGDAMKLEDLKEAIVGCDAVVNTAGFAAAAPWSHSSFPDIGKCVIDAANEGLVGPKRVWITAGMFVMDQPGGGLLTDSNHMFKESKVLWDYLQAHGEGLDWTMICPSLMYAGEVQPVEEGIDSPAHWPIPSTVAHIPVLNFFATTLTAAHLYKLSYETYAKYIIDHLQVEDGHLRARRVALRLEK